MSNSYTFSVDSKTYEGGVSPEKIAQMYYDGNKVEFLKTHPDAVLPERNHKEVFTGDTGYDVTAVEDTVIPARGAAIVPIGLRLANLPPAVWIRIESRSGLQFKHGISAFNGIIDNQYRGDMGIRLLNHTDTDYTVKKGDRVAQLVLYNLLSYSTSFVEQITETERGEKGFGSSGR
jgi:dUTP pyrophosphatase